MDQRDLGERDKAGIDLCRLIKEMRGSRGGGYVSLAQRIRTGLYADGRRKVEAATV